MSRYRCFPFELNMSALKEIAFNAEATYGDFLNTIWYRYPDGIYGNRRFLDIMDETYEQSKDKQSNIDNQPNIE